MLNKIQLYFLNNNIILIKKHFFVIPIKFLQTYSSNRLLYKSILKKKKLSRMRLQKKKLKLVGIGYKINIFKEQINNFLYLQLGYSHNICLKLPYKIKIKIIKQKTILIYSFCKQTLNNFIITLRSYRYPDNYKGKGILYNNEKLVLKKNKKI